MKKISPEQEKLNKEAYENIIKSIGDSDNDWSPAKKRKGSPVSKEQFEALYNRKHTSSQKKKHKLEGHWKSKNGNLARLQLDGLRSGGYFYLDGYKSMYWESQEDNITFYKVESSGGDDKFKGMRAVYNDKTDDITFYGGKYNAVSFYRYDDARKEKEKQAKIEKQKRNRAILQRAMLKDEKREVGEKALLTKFNNTLTCNNCDLTILGDYNLDYNWSEASGSNFSKKNKLWSRYQLKWANLKGADFSGTTIRDTTFYRANLSGADFSGARIGTTNFAYANLENANFRNAVIGESLFNGANLKNADFTGATIVRADFSFSNQVDWIFKPILTENVKLKASPIDHELVGVWFNSSNDDVYYYEFFEDGSYINTFGSYNKALGKSGVEVRFAEQLFYSVRDGNLVTMTPDSVFRDSSQRSRIDINDNLFNTGKNNYTRAEGKSLEKYKSFRNNDYALIAAFQWNIHLIEKLSADGVNFAEINNLYSFDTFDHLFGKIRSQGLKGKGSLLNQDRTIRHIFSTLISNNEDYRSGGTKFQTMVFHSLKNGYVDTVKYLLTKATKKADLKYALIDYEQLDSRMKRAQNGDDDPVALSISFIKQKISKM
ncbi:MAG: pentapeptide repeat-containing protein [Gammaproteobacteria bacterium]|nr:pentapeptide repeat-containing protein [Gammaproteobacteria bacterium]MCF6260941.1 pentapeptide repeat-containing protein [Gammaproteobacteria bacterium]